MNLVAGIGLNSRAGAGEIVELVEACLAEAGFLPGDVALLASAGRKAGNPALLGAAAHFGVPLRLVADEDLREVASVRTSALALERVGLGSVAEAAAGHFGAIVLGKRKSGNATCAIAEIAP